VLDIGLSSPNKMEFFDTNSKAIDTLFGKQHSERIKALFEASERLAKFPVSSKINPSLSQRTAFEGATGSRIEQVAGAQQGSLLNAGQTASNVALQNAANLRATTTTGLLAGASDPIANLIKGLYQPPVVNQGYSTGTGPAYAGSYSGLFTPNRQGM